MTEQPPTKPSERTWTVPCFFRNQETGEFLRDPDTGALIPDHQETAAAYAEARAILRRTGGVMQVGTKREEVEPGRIETTELLFRHQAFVPIVQEPAPAAATEEPAEPEAAAAKS